MLTLFITLVDLGERIYDWGKTQEIRSGRY
jgi:hypothetical protein